MKVDALKNEWLEKRFNATSGRKTWGAPDQQPPSIAPEGGNAESGASSASDLPEGQGGCPSASAHVIIDKDRFLTALTRMEQRSTSPEAAKDIELLRELFLSWVSDEI